MLKKQPPKKVTKNDLVRDNQKYKSVATAYMSISYDLAVALYHKEGGDADLEKILPPNILEDFLMKMETGKERTKEERVTDKASEIKTKVAATVKQQMGEHSGNKA
jgi:hypothetical protein